MVNIKDSLTVLAAILGGCVISTAVAHDDNSVGRLSPIDLRCEYLLSPLGIDDLSPRLSWKLTSLDTNQRGQRQSAYQILVASSQLLLDKNDGDLWNSGRVESSESILVPYAGRELHARTPCYWKVRVWDERHRASEWSSPAVWTMGLLTDESWRGAKWVGHDEIEDEGVDITALTSASWIWRPGEDAPENATGSTQFFYRDIEIPANRRIVRAYCFFAGSAEIEFAANGALVGRNGHGGPSLIGEDVSDKLMPGVNRLSATVKKVAITDGATKFSGWICLIRIDFEDGDPMIIRSDNDWKTTDAVEGHWQSAANGLDAGWTAARQLGIAGDDPAGFPWKLRWRTEHRRLAGRYLRKEFTIPDGKSVVRATAYVCGLGFFDLHVNGNLIGDQLTQPALTGYNKRALYVTLDITKDIRPGSNAVGAVLSNGRFFAPRVQVPVDMQTYGYPKMIGQIHLEFSDGTDQTIVTDETWKLTTDGPLRASSEYDGEEYDARKEMPGWTKVGYDDSSWRGIQIVDSPGGHLEAQMIEPIRVIETLKPSSLLQPKPGVWMVGFDQAFYGVVRLKVAGPAGTRIKMRTSYSLHPDGTLNFINDRSAENTDVYTLKGGGEEEWHPRFRGNATRWVQVEGFPGVPTTVNFEGLVTHTDHQPVGEFACSSDLVNHVYRNARWGTRMQNRSLPMEPDRDERMPWSGHPAKTSESEGWVFNVARFYEHFVHNFRTHQAADGHLQEVLPPYWTFDHKDIVWPSVITIIPDWYYNFYGDKRLLSDNYEMMKRFVLYHEKTHLKSDNTTDYCTFGDWVDTASIGDNSHNHGATSRPLIATAYLYNNCRIVERAAHILGKSDDQEYFHELADRIRDGFNQRFFDKESGTYESETQCSAILPLQFGLVPAEHQATVVNRLVDDISLNHNGHTSVGLIGAQWQMQVLSNVGHPEVAYQIATQTSRPSWGYMISKGATTIWERWDTDTQGGGMNGESQKILSGNFEAWCYQTLAGINYDPDQPGFKHIILRPRPVGDLIWARASHDSPYGKIVSDWKLNDGALTWHVVVPPNTTATAYIPTTQPNKILESGKPIADVSGIQWSEAFGDDAVLKLESGTYEFTAPMNL